MEDRSVMDQKEELEGLLERLDPAGFHPLIRKEIAPKVDEISQDAFTGHLHQHIEEDPAAPLVLDVRSEGEFAKDRLPFAVNLPILSDKERHEVGLLYKRHNREFALGYAFHLAKEKEEAYIRRARELAGGRDLILYCWRGGGRSRYATGTLARHGLPVRRLVGGQKGFRRQVYQLLYHGSFSLWPLSGKTGCGKSELIERLETAYPSVPVLHLEAAAGHAASVFGRIRFDRMGQEMAADQRAFETALYVRLLRWQKKDGSFPPMITEMESKKIGALQVPPALYAALQKGDHIALTSPIGPRVTRLKREYFGDGDGAEAVKESVGFLTRRIGGPKVREWCDWIDAGAYDRFLSAVLTEYYDHTYKPVEAPPAYTVDASDLEQATARVARIWKEIEAAG